MYDVMCAIMVLMTAEGLTPYEVGIKEFESKARVVISTILRRWTSET